MTLFAIWETSYWTDGVKSALRGIQAVMNGVYIEYTKQAIIFSHLSFLFDEDALTSVLVFFLRLIRQDFQGLWSITYQLLSGSLRS